MYRTLQNLNLCRFVLTIRSFTPMDALQLYKEDEVMKEDMRKRGLCINNTQDRNNWKQCCRRVVDPD